MAFLIELLIPFVASSMAGQCHRVRQRFPRSVAQPRIRSVGREMERLVSRFPGLMDRGQVNIRIANSRQRNYRRIRRPRWPIVSSKTIDPPPFHEEITRNQSTESLSFLLSLSLLRVYQYDVDLFSSSLSLSLSGVFVTQESILFYSLDLVVQIERNEFQRGNGNGGSIRGGIF